MYQIVVFELRAPRKNIFNKKGTKGNLRVIFFKKNFT